MTTDLTTSTNIEEVILILSQEQHKIKFEIILSSELHLGCSRCSEHK
jgi:hypothetical protein